jgi:hypothetical protein
LFGRATNKPEGLKVQNPQEPMIAELSANIGRLRALAAQSEARLRRLESRRWIPGAVTGALVLLAFVAGHFSGSPPLVWAGNPAGALERHEQPLIQKAERGIRAVESEEERERQRFGDVMEGVRRDINRAKDTAFEPAIAIAVILHDMKRMLEAVPRMADDMHRMTGDMHEMNQKMSAVPAMAAEMNLMNRQMGVMSHGVDSTMGRMGRMMPWAP